MHSKMFVQMLHNRENNVMTHGLRVASLLDFAWLSNFAGPGFAVEGPPGWLRPRDAFHSSIYDFATARFPNETPRIQAVVPNWTADPIWSAWPWLQKQIAADHKATLICSSWLMEVRFRLIKPTVGFYKFSLPNNLTPEWKWLFGFSLFVCLFTLRECKQGNWWTAYLASVFKASLKLRGVFLQTECN